MRVEHEEGYRCRNTARLESGLQSYPQHAEAIPITTPVEACICGEGFLERKIFGRRHHFCFHAVGDVIEMVPFMTSKKWGIL
jgi:hypothetical protein